MDALDPRNLTHAQAYARPAEIRRLLAELRQSQPICWVEPDDIRPYWAVTRYQDIRYIESTPALFSAEPRAVVILEALEKANLERFGDIMGVKTLVHMDGPQHMALRKLTRDWFMPANIAKLRGHVEGLAEEFIGQMRERDGRCDFAGDIAFWYPLRVVMQLIGIPRQDEADILALTQRLFAPDAYISEDKDSATVFMETVQAMSEYFSVLVDERRRQPRDDIASVLANARLGGELIDPFTLTSYLVLLATAGHDTTSASLAGGLLALLQHPEQLRRLQGEPALCAGAADEMIRWVSPVKHFARTVLADTELAGAALKKGDTVVMFFESANRDAQAIAQPDVFDVGRPPSKHLAFGHGRHNCLGMHLARMEITCFMQQLLPQLASLELAGEPGYIPSHFVSGLSSLPIRYRFK
ncbi:cytochrome P450 [Spongiibacter sp.]|uniref:cytochrome P450 n=1 Tax=Spongiibacter sp. TaxID=2024860 RepID=UPI0035693342